MSVSCRFNSCSWVGKSNKLLQHCQTRHRKFIRTIRKDTKEFKFDFDDFLVETILLVGLKGDLYWFLTYEHPSKEFFKRGVFAVEGSELCNFESVVGQDDDIMLIRMGIYQVEPEDSVGYQLKYWNRDSHFMVSVIESRKFSLFFYVGKKKQRMVRRGLFDDELN